MSLGLYLHIPYCFSKCRYCDFYSHPGERGVPDAYVDALLRELHRFAPDAPLRPDTLYFGNFYGTPKRYVDEAMAQGKDVILDIEVQGALQVIGKRPDTVRIFIAPPSWDALEQRLTGRGTDSPEKIQKRLVRAKVELQTADTYDYFVINDTVENAVREINAIMLAEHCRPSERMEILQ